MVTGTADKSLSGTFGTVPRCDIAAPVRVLTREDIKRPTNGLEITSVTGVMELACPTYAIYPV